MKIKLLLSVICLLGASIPVFAQSGAAPAQSAVAKPIPNTTILGKHINAQVAPCDPEEDEGCPSQPAAPDGPPPLVPKNPNGAKYEKDRIKIQVTSPRHFGQHIGDLLTVQYQIETDSDVVMDFTLLKQGKFKAGGVDSNFSLVPGTKAIIESQPNSHIPNTIDYRITLQLLYLQKLENTPFEVPFNIDLSYAMDPPKDPKKAKNMKWSMLTTPDFVFSMTTLADNGKELLEGDISVKEPRTPWATYPLLALGLFIILWYGIGKDLVWLFNRVKKAIQKPAEYQAWKVFNKVFADAAEYKQFTPVFAQKVSSALRKYLNISSQTVEQIAINRADDANLPLLLSALNKLEAVIYARPDSPVVLTDGDIAELKSAVTLLVPKEAAKKGKKEKK